MKLLVCLCAAVTACALEVPQVARENQRVETASPATAAALSSEARFGTAPHESIDASAFVGAFEAQSGEVIEFREDGTYGARLDGRLRDGVWYAFGAHVELDEITSLSSHRGFDLVAVDDELVLVPDDRLSKLVVDVRSGLELSREWLRRALPAGAARPDLPPPFDEIARMRGAAVELEEWRGRFHTFAMEQDDSLEIDAAARYEYSSGGCWRDDEHGCGSVAAFGELVMLRGDVSAPSGSGSTRCGVRTVPRCEESMIFVPLRHGARRYVVPCDRIWEFGMLQRLDPELVEQRYMHDGVDPGAEDWNPPRAFERWFSAEPISARITRLRSAGPTTRLVSVVTLDVGRKHGAFRPLLLSSAEGRGAGLRVVLVREFDCDAVLTDADDGATLTVGAVFRAETF